MTPGVKLIAITKPVDPNLNVEQFLAYVARVSNPKNQENHETAPKLLKYLIKNNHWSPLELAHIVMEIVTTRDIGRQILRHKSFTFQEFSQRYAEVSSDQFIIREARLQDTKNRQNSIEVSDRDLESGWKYYQNYIVSQARLAYEWAIANNIAKEQARVVLPEGLTLSRMYMAGTLRSWVHYCALRSGNGTQKEHQEIAKECFKIILELFPSLKDIVAE